MGNRISAFIYDPCQLPRREEDLELVRRILEGEAGLWDALYEDAYGKVLRAAGNADYDNLLTACEYEDIADEAFALCYRHLERFQGRSRFCYWVCGYAKNLTRNRLRREYTKTRNQRLLEYAVWDAGEGCNPLGIITRLERNQCLWSAFYDLPVLEQIIVSRRVFFDTAFRELARELQLTRKEVCRRFAEALLVLRCNFCRLYWRGSETAGVLY